MSGKYRYLAVFAFAAVLGVWLWTGRTRKPIPRSSLAFNQRDGVASKEASPLEHGGRQTLSGLPTLVSIERSQPVADAPSPDPMGVPRWYPRPTEEWQGMLVNLNITPPCDSSATCGLGRACILSKCMPCELDEQCASGEVCVLEHCLHKEFAACRRAAECQSHSKCVLSGYSSGPRGTEDTHSDCVSPLSGAEHGPRPPITAPAPDTRASLPEDDLLKSAHEAALER